MVTLEAATLTEARKQQRALTVKAEGGGGCTKPPVARLRQGRAF
jgi:hypothetical protein